MAVIFTTGFNYASPDGSPVLAADFTDYPTILSLSGAGTDQAMVYTPDCYVSGGTGALVDTNSGAKFILLTYATQKAEVYARAYIYVQKIPATNPQMIMRWRSAGTGEVSAVFLNTTGKFFLAKDGNSTSLWTSASAYADQWIRLEWRVTQPTSGAGTQRLKIFSGSNIFGTDTTTNYEISTPVATTAAAGQLQKFAIGGVTTTEQIKFAMDAVQLDDSNFPGPIVPQPEASFTMVPAAGAAPLSVVFNNTSIFSASYSWDFGDRTTSAAVSPTHNFTAPGTYDITLTASSSDGTKRDTITTPLVVTEGTGTGTDTVWSITYEAQTVGSTFADPLVNVVARTGTGVISDTAVGIIQGSKALAIDATYGAFNMSYMFGTAQQQMFFRNYVTVTKAPTGDFMVLASVRNNAVDMARVTVDEHGKWALWRGANGPLGNMNIESDVAISHGAPIRMEWFVQTNTGAPGTQRLELYIGSNMHGTTPNLTLTGDLTGDSFNELRYGVGQPCNGKVTMDSTALNTAKSPSAANNPLVLAGVPLPAIRAQKLTIAKGDSVAFKSFSTTNPTSWSWNFGDSTTDTAQDSTHTFATGGTFIVTHRATNATGQSATAASLTVTAIDPARGQAVPKVRSAGAWKAESATATGNLVNFRRFGKWNAGRFRVYKNGFWSSNDPIGGNSNTGTGFGPGTASSGIYYGTSLGTNSNATTAYNDAINTFGNVDLTHTYQGGWAATWSNITAKATVGDIDVRMVTLAMRTADWTTLASGTTTQKNNLKGDMVTFLNSIPTGQRVWISCNHEPEDDVPNGDFTTATWKDAQRMWQDAVTQVRAARTSNKNFLKFHSVLMGWTFDPRSGRNIDSWAVAGLDAWGFDAYNLGPLQNARDYAEANGMQWVVPEWGSDIKDDTSRRDYMFTWWKSAVPGASTKPKGLAYWNAIDSKSGYNSIIYPATFPKCATFWGTLCQTGAPPTALWP